MNIYALNIRYILPSLVYLHVHTTFAFTSTIYNPKLHPYTHNGYRADILQVVFWPLLHISATNIYQQRAAAKSSKAAQHQQALSLCSLNPRPQGNERLTTSDAKRDYGHPSPPFPTSILRRHTCQKAGRCSPLIWAERTESQSWIKKRASTAPLCVADHGICLGLAVCGTLIIHTVPHSTPHTVH
jgi:hypothetical protein